jgi:hypothetical protein
LNREEKAKVEAKKEIKKIFEEKFKSQGEMEDKKAHAQFFFKKLKF